VIYRLHTTLRANDRDVILLVEFNVDIDEVLRQINSDVFLRIVTGKVAHDEAGQAYLVGRTTKLINGEAIRLIEPYFTPNHLRSAS
jgi:hypothetical protein